MSNQETINNNDCALTDENKSSSSSDDTKHNKLKEYRTRFYREKYRSDKTYRDTKRQYNKQRYHRKTLTCIQCTKRWNYETLFEPNINHFVCADCLPENQVAQIKSTRGRPRKSPKKEKTSS